MHRSLREVLSGAPAVTTSTRAGYRVVGGRRGELRIASRCACARGTEVCPACVASILRQMRRSFSRTPSARHASRRDRWRRDLCHVECSARFVILLSALRVMASHRVAGALGDTRVRGAIYETALNSGQGSTHAHRTHHVRYFDLEDAVAEARLAEPMTTLAPLRGLVILDESASDDFRQRRTTAFRDDRLTEKADRAGAARNRTERALSPTSQSAGISTSAKLPGVAPATAAAIAESLVLMSLHRPLLRTTSAIVRPDRFC
jgi:hypothetical protein